jgi:type IV pilus assembly protein PilO
VAQLTVDPEPAAPPEGGGDYQVVPVTMQFQGTYDEMQDFLLRTRNLARLVTVTNITYCKSQDDTAGAVGDTETSITCPAPPTEGEGEVTTLNPSVETLLDVEIKSNIYYQPTDATSGEVPPTVVPETTTAETTSGG